MLGNVLEKFDSILCIGCPRVFEELWNTTKNAFLLDLDHRLVSLAFCFLIIIYHVNAFVLVKLLFNGAFRALFIVE